MTEFQRTRLAYSPEHFIAQEFVSRRTYEKLGDKALRYIDSRILSTADLLRKQFGTTTINNWSFGGKRQYSGLRCPHEPYYREWSDHSFGRAIDAVFKNYTAQQVRDYIEAYPEQFPDISFIEEGQNITWLHAGCPNLLSINFKVKYDNSLIFWNKDTGQFREILRAHGNRLNARK